MSAEKVQDLLARNKKFTVALAPPWIGDISSRAHAHGAKGVVIISCSDPRVIPEEYFGFGRNEAAVIRNAGGRASDALRSIVSLDAIGNLATIIVVHHTDCGMTHTTDAKIREVLKERAPELSSEIDGMAFGEIPEGTVDASIREDVALLKASPFLAKDLNILGYSLDIKTGQLTEVK